MSSSMPVGASVGLGIFIVYPITSLYRNRNPEKLKK